MALSMAPVIVHSSKAMRESPLATLSANFPLSCWANVSCSPELFVVEPLMARLTAAALDTRLALDYLPSWKK